MMKGRVAHHYRLNAGLPIQENRPTAVILISVAMKGSCSFLPREKMKTALLKGNRIAVPGRRQVAPCRRERS